MIPCYCVMPLDAVIILGHDDIYSNKGRCSSRSIISRDVLIWVKDPTLDTVMLSRAARSLSPLRFTV